MAATNIIFASEALKQLERESREIAALRAANVARLHQSNEELRAKIDFNRVVSEVAGGRVRFPVLEAWSERLKELGKYPDDKKQREIDVARIGLVDWSNDLAIVAEKLAVLAEEVSFEERGKFLAGFFKEVSVEVQVKLEEGDDLAKRAKAGLDALNAKLSRGR